MTEHDPSNSVGTDSVSKGNDPVFASLTGIVADWAVSSRVTVVSTTRLGGVSQAPFDSLNLGLHVGDDVDAVLENRRRLVDSFVLPESPRWLNQTHGTDIVSFKSTTLTQGADASGDALTPSPINADGAYTNQPGVVVAVMTADCLPVVIGNTEGTEIAVVHAGWRGLAGGILGNALKAFMPGQTLHAWLGPAIGADAFEVGDDVRQAFVSRHAAHESAFRDSQTKGKYRADLYALARAELERTSAVEVTGGDYCTYTQNNLFHSHRRDGVSSGRMATVAWIGRQAQPTQ